MKRFEWIFGVAACLLAACGPQQTAWEAASPDGRVRFRVETAACEAEGETQLQYTLRCDDSLVVAPSLLGVVMNGCTYGRNARIESVGRRSIDEPYTLLAGKRMQTRNRCEELTLTFSGGEQPFQVIVRVFDDGAAFRYAFPAADSAACTIGSELTEFAVPAAGAKAWIHPYDWNDRRKPSYEQYAACGVAVNSLPGHDRGWAFPMLFELPGHWMMITEALLDGSYPATHIDNSGRGGVYRIRFPEADEPVVPDAPEPVSTLPWQTPWRVIAVGGQLQTIFETQLVTHLNPPAAVEDTAWIRPGRAAWSWWYEGASTLRYADQLRYVDFCREMGWEYLLIDAGWQRMDGPGVEGVVAYAAQRDVGIWLWYHSGAGSNAETPPQHRIMSDPQLRRAEMERISRLGVKGIKVDFFDTDKQAVVALYPAILRDAAEFRLLVDLHGATLPRGFERTYPHLMTTEAIRGAETLGRQDRCDRAAAHDATVPFTRNVVGSMDYTPVTFSDKIRQGVPAHRRTSAGHQLALAVVFESGLQCFADRLEAYRALPEAPRDFLRRVPAAWEESRLLAGYPSDFAVVARRRDNTWYIGGISGREEAREIEFALPEACAGRTMTLIADGADNDSFSVRTLPCDGAPVRVAVAPNGGFAAIIE